VAPNNENPNNFIPLTTTQAMVPGRSQNNNGENQRFGTKQHDRVERATSPVDERILNEFYSDLPRDLHQYQLEGRQYVVYEGKNFSDIDPYRKGK
jgi:hypothetical protein